MQMSQMIEKLRALEPSPMALSYSKVKLALACGRMYKARYIDKKSEDITQVYEPAPARVGKFLHKVLEYAVEKGQNFGYDIDSVDFGLTWQAVQKDMQLTSSEWDMATAMRHFTRERLISVLDLIQKYGLDPRPEKQFNMNLQGRMVHNAPYPAKFFTGYIDLWATTPNARAAILLDYKSHKKSDENAEDLARQTALYTYFMFLAAPKVETIQPGGVYLPENLTDLHPIVRRCELQTLEDTVLEWLARYYEKLKAGDFEPSVSKQCNWCGYEGCPIKPKKRQK